jgi:MoaA/NifB/PqqE/SkfB family radical SAM enzyme
MDVESKMPIIKETISDVSISMDGIGESHDEFRGTKNSFDNLVKTVAMLRENEITVRISSMVWRKNVDQLEQMILLAKKIGAYRIHFSMLVSAGRTADNIDKIALADDDYEKTIKRIHELIKKYSKNGFTVSVIRDKCLDDKSDSCHGGERILHINTRGEIFPCSWVAKCSLANKYGLKWGKGNINDCFKKAKSLQVLVGERSIILGTSGCPAMASHYYNDDLADDPINKLLKKTNE